MASILSDKSFKTAWETALDSTDHAAFLQEMQQTVGSSQQVLLELENIWNVAHMSFKDLRAHAKMTQVAFADRLCVGRRTVQSWENRVCPHYIRLLIAQSLGLIEH